MQRVDEFLKAVQAQLRCPEDRRPTVVEELRAHLSDRTDALTDQGMSRDDAERQAVGEMLPVWLLALRLSAANGWNAVAHGMRGAWMAGAGMLLAAVYIDLSATVVHTLTGWVQPMAPRCPTILGLQSGWQDYLLRVPGHVLLMAPLFLFAFLGARSLRSWVWAIAPAWVLACRSALPGLVSSSQACTEVLAASAAIFIVSALAGRRQENPRPWRVGWGIVALPALGANWAQHAPTYVPIVAGALLLWLGSWALERAGGMRPDRVRRRA